MCYQFLSSDIESTCCSGNVHTLTKLDVNECLKNNGECHAQRKCINSAGSMSCGDCAAGWDNDGAKGCKGVVIFAQ